MKLLEKNEILKSKSLARKNEIDEGIKLAQKVDALRELVGKEQANLIKFRNTYLVNIQAEIEVEINKRDSLRIEVASLERQKELLKKILTEST